jgi:2',3'-cyclic-nucleotide 2'-phosphodiesterase (5'-nucleotidase family)
LTILHTNDFHNRLTQAQADRLRLMRDSLGDAGLLLDAGDAVSAGNVTFHPSGEPILDRMTQAGYDAMTVGNREFHVTRYGFHCTLARAGFPVLCANIRCSRSAPETDHAVSNVEGDANLPSTADGSDPPVRPYVIFSPGSGWRVVVLGLTVPMVTERMAARVLSAYLFSDPILTASKLVPQLRRRFQPDLVVALTHIGARQDRRLAEAVPGVDLILGGHSHDMFPEGERIGQTLICQTGYYAKRVGRVMVERTEQDTLHMTASLEVL